MKRILTDGSGLRLGVLKDVGESFESLSFCCYPFYP